MRKPTSWQSLLRPGDATDFFLRRPVSPFDPKALEYSPTNALFLAELSRLVYRWDVEEQNPPPRPTRKEFVASIGLNEVAFFQSNKRDTQAMLVEQRDDPAFAVLVFRGTEQKLQDWVTNLGMGGDALIGDDYAVHRGFQRSLDPVWPEIEGALDGLSCPVFYTGHSLGGALATLAAARRRPSALYTFGSPRVGNEKFAEGLAGLPIYRVVDGWDVVASVPPESFGFCHVGGLIELKETGARFTLNPLTLLKLVFSPAKPLADHAPVNYVDRV